MPPAARLTPRPGTPTETRPDDRRHPARIWIPHRTRTDSTGDGPVPPRRTRRSGTTTARPQAEETSDGRWQPPTVVVQPPRLPDGRRLRLRPVPGRLPADEGPRRPEGLQAHRGQGR